MSIPNATAAQLASQARVRARAGALLEEIDARQHPLIRLGDVLDRRPELVSMPTFPVVLAETARWSA